MDESIDFSKALEKVQDMLSGEDGQNQLSNIIGMLTNGQSSDTDTSSEEYIPHLSCNETTSQDTSGLDFDLDMFLKIQKILSSMKNRSNNTKVVFLQSLKPFLNSGRRTHLDRAVKMINVLNVIKAFNDTDKGGNGNLSPL